MRLIDQIRTGCSLGISGAGYVPSAEWESLDKRLRDAVDGIPVIVADNIDEFFYDSHPWLRKRDQMEREETQDSKPPERLVLADEYPNAAPPFPRMWIEWKPSTPWWRQVASRFGALVSSELVDGEFRIEICGFCQIPGKAVIMCSRGLWVTADQQGVCRSIEETKVQLKADLNEQSQEGVVYVFAHVPLLTMCFMNCSNVHVDWLPAAPERDKAFMRKHGILPARRVGNIVITPMTKLIGPVLADGRESIEHRKRQAANLCRGHFKTYTEERKLFGKVAGRFFWRPQDRNSNSQREVERGEYRINTHGIDVKNSK